MQAPKQYVVSALISVFALLSAGYAQRNNTHTGPTPINDQNSKPLPDKPSGASNPVSPSAQPGATTVYPPTGMASSSPATAGAAGQNGSSPLTTSQLPSIAQTGQSAVPSYLLYKFLFDNVTMIEQLADKDDREGKHEMAARWRTNQQRAAGLNETEGDILKEVALDCHRAVQEQDAKIKALLQKLDAQRVQGVVVPASPELDQMLKSRNEIIQAHIDKLKEALGESSFAKVDHYVRSSFQSQVISANPGPASTPAKTHRENQ